MFEDVNEYLLEGYHMNVDEFVEFFGEPAESFLKDLEEDNNLQGLTMRLEVDDFIEDSQPSRRKSLLRKCGI